MVRYFMTANERNEIKKSMDDFMEKLNINMKKMEIISQYLAELEQKKEIQLKELEYVNKESEKLKLMLDEKEKIFINTELVEVILVDNDRNDYVSNGLVDLNRDVLMRLVRIIGNDDKIRNLIGMTEKLYMWSKLKIFRWARQSSCEKLENSYARRYLFFTFGFVDVKGKGVVEKNGNAKVDENLQKIYSFENFVSLSTVSCISLPKAGSGKGESFDLKWVYRALKETKVLNEERSSIRSSIGRNYNPYARLFQRVMGTAPLAGAVIASPPTRAEIASSTTKTAIATSPTGAAIATTLAGAHVSPPAGTPANNQDRDHGREGGKARGLERRLDNQRLGEGKNPNKWKWVNRKEVKK